MFIPAFKGISVPFVKNDIFSSTRHESSPLNRRYNLHDLSFRLVDRKCRLMHDTKIIKIVETESNSDSTAQVHLLINAMASFGENDEGVGMTGNALPVEYSHHSLTLPQ